MCLLVIFLVSGLMTVFATNQAPLFTEPTSPINVAENEKGLVLLYTLTVSDTDNDLVTCSIQETSPNTFDFGVWQNSTDYGLYLLAGSTLSFSITPEYTLTLGCTDDIDTSNNNVTVNVIPNSPPSFNNLPATKSNVNAKTVELGDVVYTVTATDTDSSSLTFSMTSNPVSPALFTIDAVSGQITATQDLVYAVDNAYDLTVTVSDSKDTTTSNLVLSLINVNTAPIIDNLPATINVLESTGGNTVIFTLSVTEPDGGDSTTITYVVTPSVYTAKFTLNNQQVRITNNNRFNYELQNFFTVTFTVSDGKVSNGGYVLQVNIIDVNENCQFEHNQYYITMQEGNIGSTAVDPGFNVTDEDAGDSFTYYLQNVVAASYFTIDPDSGNISFAVNYDADATHPSSTSFRVFCLDSFGSTDSIELFVTIEDINDNAPTFGSTSLILYFDQTMTVPYTVSTLNATDADSGDNALLHYSWTTTGTGSTYFMLNPSGSVLLIKDPSTTVNYGDRFRFLVTVRDNGTPALSGTTTLDLIYREVNATTPVPTTTTSAGTPLPSSSDSSFWDKPGNIVVLLIGCILGITLLGITTYAIYKLWQKKRSTTPEPSEVEPEPKQQRSSFDFWRNDDIQSLATTLTKHIGQPSIAGNAPGHPPPVV